MAGLALGFKLLLSGLASVTVLAQSNGGSSGKYVSDARLVYATSESAAKEKLPEGYELATATPLYDHSEGEDTFLAIKRTDYANNAIRDIRAMNMIGGWSVNTYANLLEEQEESIGSLVQQIKPALADYRSKYALGEEKSKQGNETGTSFATDVFGALYNDDLNMTMLDMFLDPSKCTDENLTTVFMQGHSKSIFSIQTALVYSTVSLNDPSAEVLSFEDLEENYGEEGDYEGCDYLNPIPENELVVMVESLNDLKVCLNRFTKSGLAEKDGQYFVTNNIMEYISSLSFDESLLFQASAEIYSYLSPYRYNGGQLVDFICDFDSTADDFDIDCVKPFILEMSDAQRSSYAYSGITNLIMAMLNSLKTVCYTDEKSEPYINIMVSELKRSIEAAKVPYVSIYSGVERSVYSADGIGFTSEAIRQNSSKNDFSSFKSDAKAEALLDSVAKCCFMSYGILINAAVLGDSHIKGINIDYKKLNAFRTAIMTGIYNKAVGLWASTPTIESEISEALSDSLIPNIIIEAVTSELDGCVSKTYKFMKFMDVFFAVQIVAFSVLLIIELAREIVKTFEEETIVYEPIPEIMMSYVYSNEKSHYPIYQNVKNVTGALADVTQAEARHHSQWVSLYYSKDENVGNPIYADNFKVITDSNKGLSATGVCRFGEKGIYSLIKFTGNNPEFRCLSFSRDSSNGTTASVFGEGNWGLAILGLEVGAIIGAGIALLAKHNQAKRKEEEGKKEK